MSSLSPAVARARRIVVEAAVAVVNNHILLPDESKENIFFFVVLVATNSFSRNRGNDCFECGERGRHCEDELFFVSGDRRDD